jgi:hypothetical protein
MENPFWPHVPGYSFLTGFPKAFEKSRGYYKFIILSAVLIELSERAPIFFYKKLWLFYRSLDQQRFLTFYSVLIIRTD